MNKIILCLTLLSICTSIVHGAHTYCENGWTAYNDEKCVKLFGTFQTRDGAEEVCRQQGLPTDPYEPRLVSIRSPAEQKFLSEFVSNTSQFIDVWIGAERTDINSSFYWNDGSAVQRYTNWAENRPSDNPTRLCVRMVSPLTFSSSDIDMKWADSTCAQAANFICERMPNWPFEHFQQAIIDARRELQHNVYSFNNLMVEMKNQLNEKYKTTQLPHQLPPWRLWPTVQWNDISDEYAGLFFRVIGEGADAFEAIQDDNSPRLTAVNGRFTLNVGTSTAQVPTNGGTSSIVSSGATGAASHWGLSFTVSTGEVRPRNTAMRMWQRTGCELKHHGTEHWSEHFIGANILLERSEAPSPDIFMHTLNPSPLNLNEVLHRKAEKRTHLQKKVFEENDFRMFAMKPMSKNPGTKFCLYWITL